MARKPWLAGFQSIWLWSQKVSGRIHGEEQPVHRCFSDLMGIQYQPHCSQWSIREGGGVGYWTSLHIGTSAIWSVLRGTGWASTWDHWAWIPGHGDGRIPDPTRSCTKMKQLTSVVSPAKPSCMSLHILCDLLFPLVYIFNHSSTQVYDEELNGIMVTCRETFNSKTTFWIRIECLCCYGANRDAMKHLIAKKLRRRLITKANYGGKQPLL